jgi:hypothetical protein
MIAQSTCLKYFYLKAVVQAITASFLMNWSCDNPTAIYSSLLIWSLINWNSNSSSVIFLWEKVTWQFLVSIQFGGVPKHPLQDQCYNNGSDWVYKFRSEFLNSENSDWKSYSFGIFPVGILQMTAEFFTNSNWNNNFIFLV